MTISQKELDRLGALVDGELNDVERAEVERRVAADEDLRQALADLRGGDAALRQAVSALADPVADAALKRRVEGAIRAARPGPTRPNYRLAWPMAAAIALATLAAGWVGGYGQAQDRIFDRLARLEADRAHDRAKLDAVIAETLERRVSGQSVKWRNPETGSFGEVTPILTYKSAGGQWCRKYVRVINARDEQRRTTAIACREPDGRWRPRVEFLDPDSEVPPGA